MEFKNFVNLLFYLEFIFYNINNNINNLLLKTVSMGDNFWSSIFTSPENK